MKANPNKYYQLVTRDTDVTAKIGKSYVKNSREEKPLGVKIDTKLSFENHVSSLCKKANEKLHAIARVVKKKCLIKAFITSQINYCPLIWMFHTRQLNNQISKIHQRALTLVCKDNTELTFNDSWC